jgi:hypothetical protein
VDEDYVRYATYDQTPNRRQNRWQAFNFGGSSAWILHEKDWPDQPLEVGDDGFAWTIDGVPDPRLPIRFHGSHPNGPEVWYEQRLVLSEDQDIPFASWREAQLMIAEVEGGQTAVNIINMLRSTHELPDFSSTDDIEIRDQVREERRRELFLRGTTLGDDLRWGTHVNWPTGHNAVLQPYGTETCIPIPELEVL